MKPMKYGRMTKRQAAAALEEFLAERPAALGRLRAELAADGLDPDALLDGTPESLTPLWRWVATRIMEFEDDGAPCGPDDPSPAWWPSWARYTSWLRPTTPDIVVVLLDGVASCLVQVVTAHAPSAVWQVAHHRIKRYHLQNHPVLTRPGHDDDVFLPGTAAVTANRLRHGVEPVVDDKLTVHALAVIARLRGEVGPDSEAGEPEPLVEVEADDDQFDVGLREDLAHEHSRLMNRMVKELKAQPGVASAYREDREVLLVRAPDWSAGDLRQWLTSWIERHVPAAR